MDTKLKANVIIYKQFKALFQFNRNKDEEYSSVEPFYAFSKITWSMG